MEEILQDVSEEELKNYERIFFELLNNRTPTNKAQFQYAWCLVRSKYPVDIKKGIFLLEDLYRTDIQKRRDYLYYMAVGHFRVKEYSKTLEYCRAFLEIEPENQQVQKLEQITKQKMNKEGKIGIALTMAGVFFVGAVVSLGVAWTKSKS